MPAAPNASQKHAIPKPFQAQKQSVVSLRSSQIADEKEHPLINVV
jgi:hypothetical protein